jgi:hypothetical protein
LEQRAGIGKDQQQTDLPENLLKLPGDRYRGCDILSRAWVMILKT